MPFFTPLDVNVVVASYSFHLRGIRKLHNQKNDSDTEQGEREQGKQAPDSDSTVTGLSVIKYAENWQT